MVRQALLLIEESDSETVMYDKDGREKTLGVDSKAPLWIKMLEKAFMAAGMNAGYEFSENLRGDHKTFYDQHYKRVLDKLQKENAGKEASSKLSDKQLEILVI